MWDPRRKLKIRRTFRSYDEAKTWRTDAAKAARTGTLAAPSKRTVQMAGDELLEKMRSGVALTRSRERYKPSVIRAYERSLRKYVYPAVGSVRLSSLRRRDVQELIDDLTGRGLTGSTVRNVLAPVQVLCRRAVQDDELPTNPTANLRLPEGPGRRDHVVPVSTALQLIEWLPKPLRALYAAAFFAGLRRGELRALRWSAIDDAVTVITVESSWDDVAGEVAPKSKKGSRTVPVAAALRRYLLAHKAATGRRGRDLVFGRTADVPFHPNDVAEQADAAWAVAAVGAFLTRTPLPVELERVTLHECRHTYVSLMFDAGFSLERIGDYVGHSSTYMVERYRHLLDGHEAEAAAQYDAYLDTRTGAHGGAHPVPGAPQTARLSQVTGLSG